MAPNDPSAESNSTSPEYKPAYQELDFSGPEDHLLTCPKCNHFIHGEDINIDKTIARCSNCQHVFGFAHDSVTGLLKPELIIPEGVEVLKLRSELDIRLAWTKTASSGARKFMTLFTFLWNIILLPFVLIMLLTGNWSMLLFMSLHLLVGASLIWYLAAIYMNRTSLSISKRKLRIRTFPVRLPLYGPKEIDTDEVDQFYVTRYTESTTNGVPNYAFALYAVMKDGQTVSLLRGMTRETQRYIEQEMEGYLGIPNRKVAEEA